MEHKNLRQSIQKILKESFFDNGDFDNDEMMAAKDAAKKDIEYSGEEFEELGSSKFEKNFDIDSFLKDLNHSPRISSLNENPKIDRPKDAEGQPLTLKARVKDIDTGNFGRIVRFGADDKGKLTVHVEWQADFGGPIPKSITYPEKIVVEDKTRIVREDEIEEGIGTGLAMKHGMNIKEEEIDEDSLEFRHTAGQRQKTKKNVPLGKHTPHSQVAIKGEGAGIGLGIKHGMNVKPTYKK